MATYVLVHGGFHGGWCWTKVRELLLALGHEVFVPTLTGLGERAHLLSPSIQLTTHIDDVLGVLRFERLESVILCGHNYGGMVITGVANAKPRLVKTLIYVDAYVPVVGQSMLDLIEPAQRQAFVADIRHQDGYRIRAPSASSYGIADPTDRAWVAALLTPQPLAACLQPLPGPNRNHDHIDKVYVWAERYRQGPFNKLYEAKRGQMGWTVYSLPCGHDVMIDLPDELVDILTLESG